MNKIRLRRMIGRLIYCFASRMPESTCKINLGAKSLRAISGKLIMESCGNGVNIEKGAYFSSDTRLGNHSGIGAFSVIANTTKYSLQGTTQGRYLTGGVPPVRFSM